MPFCWVPFLIWFTAFTDDDTQRPDYMIRTQTIFIHTGTLMKNMNKQIEKMLTIMTSYHLQAGAASAGQRIPEQNDGA